MRQTPHEDITVIWHLGFQKTGTTIFQSLIRRNIDDLERHCRVFPKRDWTQALQDAARAFWAAPGAAAETALATEARAIRDAIAAAGRTHGIVSDENIIGLEFYDHRGGMIDMAAAILPVLEAAVAPARSEFIFYTRDWDSWFRSAHNQAVKQLRNRYDAQEFRANAPFAEDWETHHRRLSGLVQGQVTFRDLGADAQRGWPMGGFILTRAGVPEAAFEHFNSPIGRNESLPPGALAFMLELNRSHIHDHGLEIVRKKVLKHIGAFS